MPISFKLSPLLPRGGRIVALAATLCLPMVARADFASDLQEPLRLLQAKNFGKAAVALEQIAARYPDEFSVHYMLGLARLGSLTDNTKAADAIKTLQLSHRSLLRAQQLAGDEQQKKETRELLTAAEAGLRELGAQPEKAAVQTAPPAAAPPAAKSKDEEIEELKRRLAELEGKPAAAKPPAKPALTIGAKPAAPPKGQAPVAAKAVALPTPARRAGYVVGRVVDSAGKPLVGAEISIFGTTISGDRSRFETVSGAGGLYSQRVPDGIYGVGGQWKTRYNDKNYLFYLDPDDGKTGVVHDAAEGIVKNFHWKIAGLKPGERAGEPNTHTEGLKYYGGHLSVTVVGHGETGEVVHFPRGSTVEMTLTPRGALVDGSAGKPQVFKRTLESDVTNQRYFTWYPSNIPIGFYDLTVQLVGANGAATPLKAKLSLDFNGPFLTSVPVNFEPDRFERVQMIQITVEAPVAAR